MAEILEQLRRRPIQGGAPTGPDSSPKDETKPQTKRADEPENQGGDTVAPASQPQGDLFLRKLQDALHDDTKAKDLESATGYSRSQLEQFMKKYEKVASPPPGPGRNIEVKLGEKPAAKPSANLPGINPAIPFSNVTKRGPGTAPQDDVRDNLETARLEPPASSKDVGKDTRTGSRKWPLPRAPAVRASRRLRNSSGQRINLWSRAFVCRTDWQSVLRIWFS